LLLLLLLLFCASHIRIKTLAERQDKTNHKAACSFWSTIQLKFM
jgi:hypothetical protein